MSKYETGAIEGGVLQNRLGLTDPDRINEEELVRFVRAEEQAIEYLSPDTIFSAQYLLDLHQNAFGEIYDFAGKYRTVNLSKEGFSFAAAAHLPENMAAFEVEFLDPINNNEMEDDNSLLMHIAAMHAELLFIHPFREGNGRTIRTFTRLISLVKRNRDIDFALITEGDNFDRYVHAVQQAALKEYQPMRELFAAL